MTGSFLNFVKKSFMARARMSLVCVLCIVAISVTFSPGYTEACTPEVASEHVAIPRPGATDVPLTAEIITSQRDKLELTANGIPVPIGETKLIGIGTDFVENYCRFNFNRVTGLGSLEPSVEYVLTWVNHKDEIVELTRFTTVDNYQAEEGQPAVVTSLKLWRVHYSSEDVDSPGNCIDTEYGGFIDIEHEPATFTGTPPESVVHVFNLEPKHGGIRESFVVGGSGPFPGRGPEGSLPVPHCWGFELDPNIEYCAQIYAIGYNGWDPDQITWSNKACTNVKEVDLSGCGCYLAGKGFPDSEIIVILAIIALSVRRRRRHRTY